MNMLDASEMAYDNGYKDGFEAGKAEGEKPLLCDGCWVWESDMNYSRCKNCCRNYGDNYISVKD